MKTLVSIKKDMEFNLGLSSLIEVLKTIAVAQYRIQERNVRTFEEFFCAIEDFFGLLNFAHIQHPFLDPGQKPSLIVAITSDSGLLGGLNIHVIQRALAELEKRAGRLVVIGERGKMYLRDTRLPFVAFSGIRDEERFGQAMQLRDYIAGEVMKKACGPVSVVFPRPLSFTVQRVELVSFLPFKPVVQHPLERIPSGLILESDPRDIVEYLIYLWMGEKLFEIFGLSRLSEFAARFIHLEGSHQRLRDMDTKIRQEYFRVRHELIDRNMRELFAGRLLYGGH